MSRKRRRLKTDEKQAPKRDANQAAVPEGAVMADTSKQVPNNSYAGPVLFYIDKPFQCVDCGKEEVWTAHQQKWYYEVAQGSLYATAIRCQACRKKHTDANNDLGDPNPIKHEGTLIKHVQSAIAEAMSEAGFVLVSKSKLPVKGSVALNYSRDDLELTCWYDRPEATLVAESLDQQANCCVIARVPMNAPRSTTQILDRIEEFSNSVSQHVASLPICGENTELEKT